MPPPLSANLLREAGGPLQLGHQGEPSAATAAVQLSGDLFVGGRGAAGCCLFPCAGQTMWHLLRVTITVKKKKRKSEPPFPPPILLCGMNLLVPRVSVSFFFFFLSFILFLAGLHVCARGPSCVECSIWDLF